MAQNYWKQGNKEDDEKINEAFKEMFREVLSDAEQPPFVFCCNDPGTVIVFDGTTKVLHFLAFDSSLARLVMNSDCFEELPVPFMYKPRFSTGDIIVSKENPEIEYKILGIGVESCSGTMRDYFLELLTTENKGKKVLISIRKLDSWGELVNTQQNDEKRINPKFKVGQTVLFDGSVLTIDHIIEGYYLFNKEGSRGCRIDQQDKFVELKFKVGDYLRHNGTGVTATVESIDVKGMCYRVHGYYPIPIVEQDDWDNLDNPKFNVGDLVVYRDLIGRVNEVTWQDHFGFAYKVGNIIDIHECDLQPADHRDVTRIVKNG